MNYKILFPICFLFLSITNAKAQDNSVAIAAAVGGLVAIGAGIASMDQLEESLEQKAVEQVLEAYPEMTKFELKSGSLKGVKSKDLSNVSVLTFELEDRITTKDFLLKTKRYILFAFTSSGWANENGINYDRIFWKRFDVSEWNSLIKLYVNTASGKNLSESIISESKIVNRGVKSGGDFIVEFDEIGGDTYYTADYSNEFKIVFNEKSLGLFLKKTGDLIQISRGAIIRSHEFLNRQD